MPAPERGLTAEVALGIWRLFALVYGVVLLGAVVVDQGSMITEPVLKALLLTNPAEVYRYLNPIGAQIVSGLADLARTEPSAAEWLLRVIHAKGDVLAILVQSRRGTARTPAPQHCARF